MALKTTRASIGNMVKVIFSFKLVYKEPLLPSNLTDFWAIYNIYMSCGNSYNIVPTGPKTILTRSFVFNDLGEALIQACIPHALNQISPCQWDWITLPWIPFAKYVLDEAIIVVLVFVSNTVHNQRGGFKQLTSKPVAGSLLMHCDKTRNTLVTIFIPLFPGNQVVPINFCSCSKYKYIHILSYISYLSHNKILLYVRPNNEYIQQWILLLPNAAQSMVLAYSEIILTKLNVRSGRSDCTVGTVGALDILYVPWSY